MPRFHLHHSNRNRSHYACPLRQAVSSSSRRPRLRLHHLALATALLGLPASLSAGVPGRERAGIPTEPVFRTVVREPGQDGVFTSRIPALVLSPKGTLIAAFDLRHENAVDLPGDIDVAIRRSSDQGTTWGPLIRALDFDRNTPGAMGNGIGDPNLFVDRVTGTLFISALWVRAKRTAEGPPVAEELAGQVMLTKSTDDGLTWSPPVNISAHGKDPAWGRATWLVAPGTGTQLQDGTLILPAYYKTYPQTRGNSYFIWSRDHGTTWNYAPPAITAGPRTSESQIVQLADGSLLLSMRRHGADKLRAWARYTWSGDLAHGAWSEPWFAVPDPTCMASLIRHPAGPLLFSNPNSKTARVAMTVRASTDGGRTWNAGRLITPNLSGYSCLAVLPDGSIGLLYETGREKYNESLHFARFPLEWVTSAAP